MSDMDAMGIGTGHSRRGFLLASAGLAAALTAPLIAQGAFAAPQSKSVPPRYEVVETGPGTYYLMPIR